LLARATAYRDAHTVKLDRWEDFVAFFTPKNPDKPEIHGGFAFCHWDGSTEVEERIKAELAVTIRCIPFDSPEEEGQCIASGRPSRRRVLFAKSY
jgi:prolyl-tRNA synthetase